MSTEPDTLAADSTEEESEPTIPQENGEVVDTETVQESVNENDDRQDDVTASSESSADASSEKQKVGGMTGQERNETFEQAEAHFSSSQLDMALDCYLKCIKGIEQGSGFLYLPQCLHKIAECYHSKDDDAKAIEFLKAEKIYYETALIDTKLMQEKIEEIAGDEHKSAEGTESEVLRAMEYENLAKLCLDKHQSQLALEFSGKATKLYQKNYGDEHAATQRCLDLFTSVYAQVGKEEYTDKLSRYESNPSEVQQAEVEERENESQVRRRRNSAKQSSSEDRRTTVDPTSTTQETQAGDMVEEKEISCCCLTLLWIALILCTISAAIMFSVVYCKVTPTSWTCHWVRVQYRSLAEHIGFVAYKLGKKG